MKVYVGDPMKQWVKVFKDRRDRMRQRAQAHKEALAEAQAIYDKYKHLDVVIFEDEGEGFSSISAAGPDRVAWDVYFDAMRERGFSAWATQKRFDKELVTRG